jgi:hypothetical protein
VQHLDPDRLVLLALSDDPEDPGESVHLAECVPCRTDLAALRTVADAGADAQQMRDLPPPPERVWRGIEAQITPYRKKERPRWMAPLVAAALAVVATLGITWIVQREPAEQITARATLSALPTVPAAAHGSVRVLADGEMRIDVRNLPLTTGYHEVWLIDPEDTKKMVSIGNLGDGPDAVLPLPPGTDLNRYRLVDVSDEAHDGNTAHSGRSLLRGTLTS